MSKLPKLKDLEYLVRKTGLMTDFKIKGYMVGDIKLKIRVGVQYTNKSELILIEFLRVIPNIYATHRYSDTINYRMYEVINMHKLSQDHMDRHLKHIEGNEQK